MAKCVSDTYVCKIESCYIFVTNATIPHSVTMIMTGNIVHLKIFLVSMLVIFSRGSDQRLKNECFTNKRIKNIILGLKESALDTLTLVLLNVLKTIKLQYELNLVHWKYTFL